jgi:hypothetical protein
VNWKDFIGLFALKGSSLWTNELSNNVEHSFETDVIVQELFWQASAGTNSMSIDYLIGKVRLDWGVGYGYRPLDVFKPYRRNPVGIQVEEGVGTAMASYYDLQGEWSFLYTDSSWTQQQGSMLEEQSQQRGFGVRRYALMGDTEWQGLLYYDDVRHGLLGGSVVTVFDHTWEMHASALYQRKYLAYDQGQPVSMVELNTHPDGFQSLVGLNWANSSGHNVIMEYWYDNRSWSHSQWQNAFDQAHPFAGNYAQGFDHINLVQHNMMLHWSLNSNSWSNWHWSKDWLWLNNFQPTFDLMLAPEDGGVIATQWVNYQMYDSGSSSISLEIAARYLGGESNSVYANLPDNYMVLLNLTGRL